MHKTSNILLLQFIEKLHKSNENQQKTFEKWQTVMQNGKVISMKFKQERPCLIIIEVHFSDNEVTMEFTGKILKDDYPLLITNILSGNGMCVFSLKKIIL